MRVHATTSRGWTCLWRSIGALALLGFVLTVFTPLPNQLFRWLSAPAADGPADAVVVLGAGVAPDGSLSEESLRRAIHGILLYQARRAPVLVFSGPSFERSPVEAQVRAAMAKAFGVPPGAIVTEPTANTTREEALRIGTLLRPRQVQQILLVTNSLHMQRARPLFERAGFHVIPGSVDSISAQARSPEGRLQLMRWVLGEAMALVYYRLAGYI
jgi:uncharacterized SAM-binding protein YcdF (DUF218 family)